MKAILDTMHEAGYLARKKFPRGSGGRGRGPMKYRNVNEVVDWEIDEAEGLEESSESPESA
jgi:hypothetical protein